MDNQLTLRPALDEMRRAAARRDAAYDGVFFVAAADGTPFCRPSCSAREGDPETARYFGSVKEALFAGYRPCATCRPLVRPGDPAWVSPLLDQVAATRSGRLRDGDLRALGIEPERARRWFQERFGLTFHAYARGRRLGMSLERVRRGEAQAEPAEGFAEIFAEALGPSTAAGTGARVLVSWIETPLGPLVAAASERGLCLLEYTDRRRLEVQIETVRRRARTALAPGTNPHLEQARSEVAEYFAGSRRDFSLRLDAPGSPFQELVWGELLRIPYGATVSYEGLALKLGSPGAQRAVGTANGQNRIAIVIPCHRVVRKGGEAGGYGGGTWRKEWLLALERGARPALPLAR